MRQAIGAFLSGLLLAVLVSLPAFAAKDTATAGRRVALVVGMSHYQNIPVLDNPKNDAQLIAKTLKGLGFILVGGGAQLDLDKAGFDRAIQSFGDQLAGADVALFYYAGHGLQVRGTNWLVPVNANPTKEADVDFQMVDTQLVLRQMESAGTKLNLVVLDACRNNPFGGRGLRAAGGGLAQMQAPEGTLISYATQPGNTAQDGTDGDSPYTKALAETLSMAGLEIRNAFNEVGLKVKKVTNGVQQPWVSASPIEGEFYFAGHMTVKQNGTDAALAPVANGSADREALFWQSIQSSTDATMYQAYLDRYPNGDFSGLAKAKIASLKNTQVALLTSALPTSARAEPSLDALDREMTVGRKASVRDAPDPKAKLVMTLAESDSIQVVGKVKGENWYAVSRKGQLVGYVVADTLEDPAAYQARRQRVADEVRQKVTMVTPAPSPSSGGSRAAGAVFRDCPDCPEMVVIPSGNFTMGTSSTESMRENTPDSWVAFESLQHQVLVRSFALGKYAVTRGEFGTFVRETGYAASGTCQRF